jgi:hypothetical protein
MADSLEKQMAVMRVYLDTAEKELASLKNGKKASSARVRKQLQSLKTESHSMRKCVMEYTKSLPTKSRVKKKPIETTPTTKDEPIEKEELPEPPKLVRETTKRTRVKKEKPIKPKA